MLKIRHIGSGRNLGIDMLRLERALDPFMIFVFFAYLSGSASA
jgi:hypothetical protein